MGRAWPRSLLGRAAVSGPSRLPAPTHHLSLPLFFRRDVTAAAPGGQGRATRPTDCPSARPCALASSFPLGSARRLPGTPGPPAHGSLSWEGARRPAWAEPRPPAPPPWPPWPPLPTREDPGGLGAPGEAGACGGEDCGPWACEAFVNVLSQLPGSPRDPRPTASATGQAPIDSLVQREGPAPEPPPGAWGGTQRGKQTFGAPFPRSAGRLRVGEGSRCVS